MSNLSEIHKDRRQRREARFYWNTIFFALPSLSLFLLYGYWMFGDVIESFLNFTTVLFWIPRFEFQGVQFGTVPLDFLLLPEAIGLQVFALVSTVTFYLFLFAKPKPNSLLKDVGNGFDKVTDALFDGTSKMGETGYDYFGRFGVEHIVRQGLTHRIPVKNNYLDVVDDLTIFIKSNSINYLFDKRNSVADEDSYSLFIEERFDNDFYYYLFRVIEAYILDNIGGGKNVVNESKGFWAFDRDAQKVRFSPTHLKEFLAFIEDECERSISFVNQFKSQLGRDLFRYHESDDVLRDEKTKFEMIAYIKFLYFLDYIRMTTNIPAGMVSRSVAKSNYDFRRIIDYKSAADNRKTILIGRNNDGGKLSRIDDRFASMTLLLYAHIKFDSKNKDLLDTYLECADPLSSIDPESIEESQLAAIDSLMSESMSQEGDDHAD